MSRGHQDRLLFSIFLEGGSCDSTAEGEGHPATWAPAQTQSGGVNSALHLPATCFPGSSEQPRTVLLAQTQRLQEEANAPRV